MAKGPQDLTQARAVNSIGDAVKAVSSGVHLQDAPKIRLTPAARQDKRYKILCCLTYKELLQMQMDLMMN